MRIGVTGPEGSVMHATNATVDLVETLDLGFEDGPILEGLTVEGCDTAVYRIELY
jgi:hypothetical protein